jgi:hypothetical protein
MKADASMSQSLGVGQQGAACFRETHLRRAAINVSQLSLLLVNDSEDGCPETVDIGCHSRPSLSMSRAD